MGRCRRRNWRRHISSLVQYFPIWVIQFNMLQLVRHQGDVTQVTCIAREAELELVNTFKADAPAVTPGQFKFFK